MKKRGNYGLIGIIIISFFFYLFCAKKGIKDDYYTELLQQV